MENEERVIAQNGNSENIEYHTYGTETMEAMQVDSSSVEEHTYDENESKGMRR